MERHVPILKGNGIIDVQSIPQLICPSCGKIITVILLSAFDEPLDGKRLFIGYFSCCGVWSVISCNQTGKKVDIFASWQIDPYYPLPHKYFSSTINRISPQFETIYNEALTAQKLKLLSICGAGYRKALEFLVYDYAIYKDPDKAAEIEKTGTFANLISTYIKEDFLFAHVNAAAWVGNEEIHYYRKHPDLDYKDLIQFINDVIGVIELNERLEEKKKVMPDIEKKLEEKHLREFKEELKTQQKQVQGQNLSDCSSE